MGTGCQRPTVPCFIMRGSDTRSLMLIMAPTATHSPAMEPSKTTATFADVAVLTSSRTYGPDGALANVADDRKH